MTNPTQKYLFPEMELIEELSENRSDVAKRIVRYLLAVRKKLESSAEREFLPSINHTVRDIRSFADLTDTQRESLILISVERQMATNYEEIAGDTRLAEPLIREIVDRLASRGILEIRMIQTDGRPAKRIYSTRGK